MFMRFLTSAFSCLALLAAMSTAHAQQPDGAFLLVGDPAAAQLHVYAVPERRLVATIDDLALAAHAGVVALPDGRVLIADDRNKQLVVLRLKAGAAPTVEKRSPMPIPLSTNYAWAAVDPRAELYAVTGLDDDEAVRLVTLVNLTTYAGRQFRVDAGAPNAELNLALGGADGSVLLLHSAERVDAYKVADLMVPGARLNALLDNRIAPASSIPVGRGGHSDSYSIPTAKWTGSTLRGFEVATLDGAGMRNANTLSWDSDGLEGGRNARQRLTADGRHVFGPLAAPVQAAQWANAEVDLHWVDLVSEQVRRTPLAKGIVSRAGVSSKLAVYASIHPDGDAANLVDVDPASATFRQVVARVPLRKLANGPAAGRAASGTEGRHAAITSDSRFAFVTHGGEGRISVIDTTAKVVTTTIETPTPLKGGGYIVAVTPGVATNDLSAR